MTELVARNGFTIDMELNGRNVSIVKDGKCSRPTANDIIGALVNYSMFDRDKENGVVTISSDVSMLKFYLRHQGVEAPPDSNSDAHKPWFATMLKHVPETRLMYPKVDSDENIVRSHLSGELHQGGLITNQSIVS